MSGDDDSLEDIMAGIEAVTKPKKAKTKTKTKAPARTSESPKTTIVQPGDVVLRVPDDNWRAAEKAVDKHLAKPGARPCVVVWRESGREVYRASNVEKKR
jgi:hypothetical protein